MLKAMAQIVVRIDDELAAGLDALVAAGVVANRSEAVRLALERLIDRHRRGAIGASIVKGYEAVPPTDEELSRADELTARMIREEPW